MNIKIALSEFMESIRKPTSDEIRIIRHLAEKAKYKLEASWESKLMVKPITDMEFGPVYLLFQSEFVEQKKEYLVSSCQFCDTDNVPVVLYLLVDEDGIPCELDMWKCDDTPINAIPSCENFEDLKELKSPSEYLDMEKRKTHILWSVDKQSCITFCKETTQNGMIHMTLIAMKNQFCIKRNVSITETEENLLTSHFKQFLADGSSCFEFENSTKDFEMKLYKNYYGDYCVNIRCSEKQFECAISLKIDVGSIFFFLEPCDDYIQNNTDTITVDDADVTLSFDTINILPADDLWEVHMPVMVKDYFSIKERLHLSVKYDYNVLCKGLSELLQNGCTLNYQASCTDYCIRLSKGESDEIFKMEIESLANSEGDYILYNGTIGRKEIEKCYSELGKCNSGNNKESGRKKSWSGIISHIKTKLLNL